MKRLFIFIIVLAVAFPLFLGGLLWFTYSNIGTDTIPDVRIVLLEESVKPQGYEWNSPVFGGMRYKEFYQNPSQEADKVGTLTETQLNLETPAGYTSTARLSYEGQDIWTGTADQVKEYAFVDNGSYELEVESKFEPETGRGYGSFIFHVGFDVAVDTRIEQSAEEIGQGEILSIQLFNLPSGAAPIAETWETPIVFVPNGRGRMIANIAASHDSPPGDYSVRVTLGEQVWTIPYTIVETSFPEQELSIDTGTPEISEANSAAAYQQYNDTIPPLFSLYEADCYWSGPFTVPVSGEVSTQYGLHRFTNGAASSSRHPAMDISADADTPVVAPAGGRVLLAQELLNTGNTLVIEHGGGLKSLFYHMNELDVAEGDMVKQGDTVGTVGSTGYSTGPHLHYEVRLFGMSVDPIPLLNGSSGLFLFDEKGDEAGEGAAGDTAEGEEPAALPDGSTRGLPPGLSWPRESSAPAEEEAEPEA